MHSTDDMAEKPTVSLGVAIDAAIKTIPKFLRNTTLWPVVAEDIGSPHQYDLSDPSEANDVVQIVCEAIAERIENGLAQIDGSAT